MLTTFQRRLLRAAFTLVACASLYGVSATDGQDSSQSSDNVADAARKAREQKKKEAAKAKKVYTNDEMGSLPSQGVSTVGQNAGSAGASGEGAQNQDAKPKEGAGDAGGKLTDADKDPEKIWRKRFHDAYAKLAQMEKELDILQREANKAQTQYYPDPQKAMAEGLSRKDINETDAKIAAKRKEIDNQKALISDMEDDLRKAGGDPGWASPQ